MSGTSTPGLANLRKLYRESAIYGRPVSLPCRCGKLVLREPATTAVSRYFRWHTENAANSKRAGALARSATTQNVTHPGTPSCTGTLPGISIEIAENRFAQSHLGQKIDQRVTYPLRSTNIWLKQRWGTN